MAPSTQEDVAYGRDKGEEMKEEKDWSGSLQIRGSESTSLTFVLWWCQPCNLECRSFGVN